jgi:MarR family transcriptional regulator for hemolysin
MEWEERFSNALHSTARAWRQAVDRRLKLSGVSEASWMAIAVAARAPQPLSQSELADALGVEGATVVAMVDRLVKSGLVVREPSTTDRRIKRVLVTEAGYSLYERVKTEAAALRQEMLASIDPESLKVATAVLERLHGMIERTP